MVVEEAIDGDDALLQGKGHQHDLIFMDINMPGKNGLEVTRAIKDSDQEAVVCLITNYDLQEYRDAAEECGADHFVVKDDLSESMIFGLVTSIFDAESRLVTFGPTHTCFPRAKNIPQARKWLC